MSESEKTLEIDWYWVFLILRVAEGRPFAFSSALAMLIANSDC